MFDWFYRKKNNLSLQEVSSFEIEPVKKFALQGWKLGNIHGLSHWQRVERNGLLLANSKVNITVVRLFAYLHDKCRIDNDRDIQHGVRATKMLCEIRHSLLKDITEDEFYMLSKACELHTTTLKTGNITIDTCFDADRLDLERVDIIPDPNRMATTKGKYWAKHLDKFHQIALG